jgi:hypothetical protein
MVERQNQGQLPAAGTEDEPPAPDDEERPERSRVMAAAVVMLLVLVPAAFVAGWRIGRTLGRLTGY